MQFFDTWLAPKALSTHQLQIIYVPKPLAFISTGAVEQPYRVAAMEYGNSGEAAVINSLK